MGLGLCTNPNFPNRQSLTSYLGCAAAMVEVMIGHKSLRQSPNRMQPYILCTQQIPQKLCLSTPTVFNGHLAAAHWQGKHWDRAGS